MSLATELAERGLVPDPLLRAGIRRLLRKRLERLAEGGLGGRQERFRKLLEDTSRGPLAIATGAANEQHYEVPADFYGLCLGVHRKYSCCLYPTGRETLDEAENLMLELVVERARLGNGQTILELGCGWGSLSLAMARRFPDSRILGVSNSRGQRKFIQAAARRENLSNLKIRTADMVDFDPGERFDRVVSVEMFEHMRNHRELFRRISTWLLPEGKVFAHIFCHREDPYLLQADGDGDWMARNFFTGGIMPSEGLFHSLQEDLVLLDKWRVSGQHYQRTAEHWLENLDRNRPSALDILGEVHGRDQAARRVQMWRMFFLACAELFGYRDGGEWFVAHYLWEARSKNGSSSEIPAPHSGQVQSAG
jgi:cyclopropane-fatty-acyl-phospholipid synthase